MLYIINSKGKREQFRSSKLSQTINKIYVDAYGQERAYMYRKNILVTTQEILQKMPSEGEIKRETISELIRNALEDSPLEIQETFIEYIENKKKRKKYTGEQVQNIDPVLIRQNFSVFDDPKKQTNLQKEYPLSVWINVLKSWSKTLSIDWDQLTKISWKVERGDDAFWVAFWINKLSSMWKKHPDAYKLASYLKVRYESCKSLGFSIFDGTALSEIDDRKSNENQFLLELEKKYKGEFVKNLSMSQTSMNIDWQHLANSLDYTRDFLIHLKGFEVLRFSLKQLKNGYEPIQWMWMRVAVLFSNRIDEIIKIYKLLSTLKFIPAEGFLREAGKDNVDVFEDSAVRVEDNLESIYQAIKETLVSTKWTGNISVDWTRVRSKDSPISGGLRKSGGVISYWKMINHALESQGRLDCPATMSLPIWHMDILNFLEQIDKLPYVKVAIKIPDYFMNILRQEKLFYLFDSADFRSIYEEKDSLKAERKYLELINNLPERHIKISSKKLWDKILDSIKNGKVRIIFSDNVQAHTSEEWIAGIDGIGIMPSSDLTWPAGVINLQGFIDKDRLFDIKELQETLGLILRVYRDFCQDEVLCLGVVGFWEFLYNQENWQERAAWLAEAWFVALHRADSGSGKMKYKYNPKVCTSKLERNRQVFNLFHFKPLLEDEQLEQLSASSMKVKSVWAPFERLSQIPEVSAGGLTFNYQDNFVFENTILPSPTTLQQQPKSFQEWRRALDAAACSNPWIDQGVAVSFPKTLTKAELSELILLSWYQGLPAVMFF